MTGRIGRPPTVSREHVSRCARHLVLEQGYTATALTDIATRAKVSRRSLGNYFPTKADIIWYDYDLITQFIEAKIGPHIRRDAVAESICTSLSDSIRGLNEVQLAALAETWAIVERNPELEITAAERIRRHGLSIARITAQAVDMSNDKLLPRVFGAILAAATTTASRQWATADSLRPLADVIDEATVPVLVGFRTVLSDIAARTDH